MDMDQEIKDYYEKYYHVTLTDEDLQKIYTPASAAAGVLKTLRKSFTPGAVFRTVSGVSHS